MFNGLLYFDRMHIFPNQRGRLFSQVAGASSLVKDHVKQV